MPSEFYLVAYKCRNCYYAIMVNIPRGKEAPNYFNCPNCGLDRLYKTSERVDWNDIYTMTNEYEIVP